MAVQLPCDMLLHPELLTNEQLLHVIRERQLKIPNIEMMSRDDILDIFHQYCVPYGQRRYRDTGRGKMLNKTRQLSPETKPKIIEHTNNGQSRKLSNYYDIERLKPPPDLLSGHMKRIKLDTYNKLSTVSIDVNYIKRKMSIDSIADESPPCKKDRKPITWP